ncbi:MAG: type I 3-dehydroquinate dehydratase [Planctomycetota bacterium]|nr:type I 3-dehydroquinate dehydratase [Planctomycetota bacterium]
MAAMTLVCVPILVDEVHVALSLAEHARLAGADLVEYRIDHLFHGEGDEEGEAGTLRLAAESPLPCIITCRPVSEGGDYDGDDAARISLYQRLAASKKPPRYIDVEHSTLARSANLRQKVHLAVEHDDQPRSLSTSLILSAHDFESRPRDLLQRLSAMRGESAARVLKLAWMARSVRDNLELFDILQERDRPTIALAMGKHGLMSRVLAAKFGGFLTFASLQPTTVTAPGQTTVAQLLETYRFRSIDRQTRVFGVMGHPVSHSLSPDVHNAGFASLEGAAGNAVYLPLPTAPGWESFKATMHALVDYEALDFGGASVTLPHKENALRFAKENGWKVEPAAERAGAANTLARDWASGGWFAANTDLRAIVECVRSRVGSNLAGKKIAVIGAGGAARGAAAGLADAGASVTIHNRTRARAENLAAELAEGTTAPGSIAAAEMDSLADSGAAVFINCTSLGMRHGPAESAMAFDPRELQGAEDAVVFDTVYTPLETPLLRAAREAGLARIDGAEMFVRQAAAQFEMFSGAEAPRGLFDQVVREALGRLT